MQGNNKKSKAMMFNKKTKQQKKLEHKKTKVNHQESEKNKNTCGLCGLEIDFDPFRKLGLLCKLSFSLSCYVAMLPP
jgi:hypothetical protein